MPLLYRGHTIVGGAAPSQRSDGYIAVTYIAWQVTATERGRHAMISRQRYATFEEASAAAFADAEGPG